jgi:hypothetical protein
MMSTQDTAIRGRELEQAFERLADDFDKLKDYKEILEFNDHLRKELLKSKSSIEEYNRWSAVRYTQRCRIATAANLSRSDMRDILGDAEWNKRDPEFEKMLSALAFPAYLPNRGIYHLGHLENFWIVLQFELDVIFPKTAKSQPLQKYGLNGIQSDHVLCLRYKNSENLNSAPLFFVPLGMWALFFNDSN